MFAVRKMVHQAAPEFPAVLAAGDGQADRAQDLARRLQLPLLPVGAKRAREADENRPKEDGAASGTDITSDAVPTDHASSAEPPIAGAPSSFAEACTDSI